MNQATQTPSQASTEGATFFNLHTSGLGYLGRIRWVEGRRRADAFLACAINAIHGSSEEPDYTYFDLKVSGQDAQAVVEQLKVAVDAGRKVLVGFKVGDIYAHGYEREVKNGGVPTGKKEWTALIKGRLLMIGWAKVDGEYVYRRPSEDAGEGESAPEGGTPHGEAPNDAAQPARRPSGPVDRTAVRSCAEPSATARQANRRVVREPMDEGIPQ